MVDNDKNKRRRLVEFKDGCRYGKFGKTKAYELIAHDRIRAYKMGGKTIIDLDSVDEYHFVVAVAAVRPGRSKPIAGYGLKNDLEPSAINDSGQASADNVLFAPSFNLLEASMATLVNFNRKIPDSREFEFRALGSIKDMVLPYTTIGAVRSGGLSAHYVEASTKGDTSKLAVFFNTGSFVDIAYFLVGGIYGYGGFIPTENLQSITISDRVTAGFYELDVVIAGETLTLAFDPVQNAYAPASAAMVSDAALAGFAARKAA